MANEAVSRKQDNRSNIVTLVSNYLPRQCGIATFTSDLLRALAAESPGTDYWSVAMNDTQEGYDYPRQVHFEVYQNKLQPLFGEILTARLTGEKLVYQTHRFTSLRCYAAGSPILYLPAVSCGQGCVVAQIEA